MAIDAGVILPWLGTHAGIQTGFSRETSLDDRYPMGAPASTNPNATGGSATHTHATSGHTHTVSSHTHGAGSTGGPNATLSVATGAIATGSSSHTHTTPTTGSASATLASESPATASGSSLPSSYGVIWVASDGSPAGVPANGYALWASDPAPSGWTPQSGPSGRYLVGASAGADAGTTSGGTHVHAGGSHDHSFSTHSHSGGTTGTNSGTLNRGGTGAGNMADTPHTHSITVATSADGDSGATASGDSGAGDTAPPSYKLAVIKNTSGGALATQGIIGAWLGTLASIPSAWALCDGTNGTPDLRDRMIIAAASDLSDIGDTTAGGAHSHSAPSSHTHDASHTHGITTGSPSASSVRGSTGVNAARSTHVHTGTTGSGGGTSGGTAETISDATALPPYRTVAWIQLQSFPQTATPDPVVIPIALPTPTLVRTYVATPSPVEIPVTATAPTLAAALAITPDPVEVPVATPAPTLVMGEKVVTPDAVEIPVALPAPTLDNQTTAVTPDPVEIPVVIPAPVAVAGEKVVTPDAVEIPVATPAPTLAAALAVAPDPVEVAVEATAPSLVAGGVTVAPDPVEIPVALPAPTLIPGAVTVTPAPVEIAVATTAPDVVLTYRVTPDAVEVPVALPAPTLVGGEKIVTPDPVAIPVLIPAPTVALHYTATPGPVVIEVTIPEPQLGAFLALAPVTLAPPTAEQVYAALTGPGAVSLRFRYSRRTRTNQLIDELAGVIEPGTITLDNRRAVVRDLALTLDRSLLPVDFDAQADIIGVAIEVYVPQADQWVAIQQGLYVLDVTETENEGARAGREIIPARGADLMMLLVRSRRTTPTTIPAGANPVTEATAIFTRHGIATNITATTKALPVAVQWAPGTSDYQIARDLLRGIHYRAPFIDRTGVATAYPLTDLAARTPAVTYQNTAEPKMISARDPYRRRIDRKGANRVVVVISHPQHPERGYVQRENADPSAPNSTAALAYGDAVAITDSSADSPTLITTAAAHGLATGVQVLITGHLGSTPSLDGSHVITVISPTTFTVPVAVSAAGYGGTVQATTVQLEAWDGNSDPPTKAVVDAVSAEGWAEHELQWAAAESEPIDLATFLDPRREADEFYELDIDGIEDGQLAAVLGWRMRLEPGAIMEHDLGRVRDLDLIAPPKP